MTEDEILDLEVTKAKEDPLLEKPRKLVIHVIADGVDVIKRYNPEGDRVPRDYADMEKPNRGEHND